MGSCPPIAVMVVGIILLIFGVLAAITGPSCSCKRAIPKFQEVQNTTQEFKCAQCSWLWLECKVNGRVQSCSRGCVLNAIENNNRAPSPDLSAMHFEPSLTIYCPSLSAILDFNFHPLRNLNGRHLPPSNWSILFSIRLQHNFPHPNHRNRRRRCRNHPFPHRPLRRVQPWKALPFVDY